MNKKQKKADDWLMVINLICVLALAAASIALFK